VCGNLWPRGTTRLRSSSLDWSQTLLLRYSLLQSEGFVRQYLEICRRFLNTYAQLYKGRYAEARNRSRRAIMAPRHLMTISRRGYCGDPEGGKYEAAGRSGGPKTGGRYQSPHDGNKVTGVDVK